MLKGKIIVILLCLISLNTFAGEMNPGDAPGCRVVSGPVAGKIFQTKIGETVSGGSIYSSDDYFVQANFPCATIAPVFKACNVTVPGVPGTYYIGNEVVVGVVNCPIDADVPLLAAALILIAVRALRSSEKRT